MINNFVTTYKLIKKNWKHLLLLVCVYNIVLFLVLVPLLSAGFNLALTMTKYSYLTENNFKNFLLRPQSIVMIIVSILLLVIFFQTQTASLFYFYEDCKNQKKMNVAQLIIAGVKSTISLVKRKAFPVFLYSLLMPVFLNIPLLLTLFRQQRRTSFIVKSMLRVPYAKPILLIAMVLLIIYLYRRLFVLPICILDKKTFKRAKKEGLKRAKGKHGSLIARLILVNVILGIFYAVLFFIGFLGMVLFTQYMVEPKVRVIVFLKVYQNLNTILAFLLVIFGFVTNYLFVSVTYVRISEPEIKEIVVESKEEADKKVSRFHSITLFNKQFGQRKQSGEHLEDNLRLQVRGMTFAMVVLSLIGLYSYFYKSGRNGSFNFEASISGIQITSHRGNSIEAPENTLVSLEKAIDAMADYAEIDVQLTKDGVPVLMHDKDLQRTAGSKVKVQNLTYEELMNYDVGGWFSEEYKDTRIPTLEEVMELCKGKIKLNIEIKSARSYSELTEKVVDLIHKYEFERQCVITSVNPGILSKVKELDDSIKTGYIMSIAYGKIYENKNIDFLSMRSSVITQNVITNAHLAGKEVHAWTVNSKTEIKRMQSLGADNIITDKPVYAREILSNFDRLTIAQYTKMVFDF